MNYEYLDAEAYLRDLSNRFPGSPEIWHILDAQSRHSDMKLFRHPCGRVMFCSYAEGINADHLEFGVSGNNYWVCRYLEDTQGIRVYDDPPVVTIGISNPNGFGIVPAPGLEEQLQAFGWERGQLLAVRNYLLSRAAVDW